MAAKDTGFGKSKSESLVAAKAAVSSSVTQQTIILVVERPALNEFSRGEKSKNERNLRLSKEIREWLKEIRLWFCLLLGGEAIHILVPIFKKLFS